MFMSTVCAAICLHVPLEICLCAKTLLLGIAVVHMVTSAPSQRMRKGEKKAREGMMSRHYKPRDGVMYQSEHN